MLMNESDSNKSILYIREGNDCGEGKRERNAKRRKNVNLPDKKEGRERVK